MPEYYTEEAIVKKKYFFVSYSHEEKAQVRNAVNWLIDEGVRLWYDADLHNGDNWIAVAQRMIQHENCIGTIFFNSFNSYISDPAAQERKLSLEKKLQWEKEGKTYHTFVVNMGKPSTMRLIKQIFDNLPDNDTVIQRTMTSEQLAVILQLFDDKRIYSFMDPEDPEGFLPAFLDGISKRAAEAINKKEIVLEQMEKLSRNAGIFFKMGKFPIGGEETLLEWQYITSDGTNGVFLLKQVLDSRCGADLDQWLNTQFASEAFTPQQRQNIHGNIRLLARKETDGVNLQLMANANPWWLADVDGAKQMVVREDGSINERGSINTRIQRGVRPVILVDLNTAKEMMK